MAQGALLAQESDVDGWNQAAGVNLTLEEGFGARHSGMGITFAGFQVDANAAANAPAAMNDVDDFTFSTAHAEKFGEAKFDDFALIIPFESRSTLGLGLSRYGVSGIDLRPEGVSPLESQPAGQFSIADYLVVTSFSRRWGGLDVGASFNFLYRQLDQDGMGMRADAMAQYTWNRAFRIGALLKGLIPSSATWESGYSEFEAPDLHLGFGARIPAPYFYGTLHAAYQTEGLFQENAKSEGTDYGSRAFNSPPKVLLAGNAGLEFLFDFGLIIRFGVSELGLADGASAATAFGIGYSWKKILGLDYSFAPHADLLASHRIALQFTPAFPKFNGRNFRPGSDREANPALRQPADARPVSEDAMEVPETPAPPGNPSIQGKEKPDSDPRSAPVSPAGTAPTPSSAPAPVPESKPAPVQPKEQLEEEEEEEEEAD